MVEIAVISCVVCFRFCVMEDRRNISICRNLISSVLSSPTVLRVVDEALHQTNSLSDSVAQLNQSAESDHHVESPVDSEVRRIFRSRILAKAPRFTARLNMSQNSRSSSRLSAKRYFFPPNSSKITGAKYICI